MTAALVYLDGGGVVLWGLLGCLLHELGHFIAIILCGGRVTALRLTAAGAEMALDPRRPLSYGREMVAALAGPGANMLAALAAAGAGWFLFAGVNLGLSIFNLLPARALDGGRALYYGVATASQPVAEHLVGVLTIITTGALLGLGLTAWGNWGNLTLLVTTGWLLVGVMRCS